MSFAVKQTAAQKRYSAACDAARAWAQSAPAEVLRAAANDRVARSYGISPADASAIISDACRQRRI